MNSLFATPLATCPPDVAVADDSSGTDGSAPYPLPPSAAHRDAEADLSSPCVFTSRQLDVREVADQHALCDVISRFGCQSVALTVELVGPVNEPICVDGLQQACREAFYSLEIIDNTQLLQSAYLQEMAKENTVRGVLAQRLIALDAATSDVAQKRIYELALRELLLRFKAVRGACA